MAKSTEKIKAAISSLESRLNAANEFVKNAEQQAAVKGVSPQAHPDYERIKAQIPVAKGKLSELYAELDAVENAESPAIDAAPDFVLDEAEADEEYEETVEYETVEEYEETAEYEAVEEAEETIEYEAVEEYEETVEYEAVEEYVEEEEEELEVAPPPPPAPKPAPPAPKPRPAPVPYKPEPVEAMEMDNELSDLFVEPSQPAAPPKAISQPPKPKAAAAPVQEPADEPFITTTPVGATLHSTTTVAMGISAESLTKRGFMLLEDGEWKKAGDKFDSALDIDPEFARAYIGLLCVELKIKSETKIVNTNTAIENLTHFKKAVRYASPEYRTKLETYSHIIQDRLAEQGDVGGDTAPAVQTAQTASVNPELLKEPSKDEEEKRKAYNEKRQAEEEEKRKAEAEAKLTPQQQAERRRAAKQLEAEEEARKNAEEQEYRRRQKEWQRKGLCYYCGGKLTLTKKCKECGKSSFSSVI
jgi:hypothetical protein